MTVVTAASAPFAANRVGDSITMFDFCENQNYIGMTLDYLLQYRWTNLHNIVAIPIDFSEFPYTVNLVANPARTRVRSCSSSPA